MVDGAVTISIAGGDGAAAITLDADLTFTGTTGGETHLVLNDVEVEVSVGAVTLSGDGSLTNETVDASFTIDQLVWVQGDCLPSGGTVSFDNGAVTGTVTFLATTPDDGIIQVQTGVFPPYEYTLAFCAQEG